MDTMKRKQFIKGISQIAQEGAIQIFQEFNTGMEEIIVGVVTLMGLFVTADIVCSTMVMGLTIAGTISVILIASGRAGRKKQIAFTPFLLLGYGLTEVFM